MGIRINKVLGWVYEEELKIDDECDKTFGELIESEEKSMTLNFELSLANDANYANNKLIDLVNNVSEEAKKPLYVFPPPTQKNFSRYNDPIDYYEAKDGGLYVKYIHKSIFPFHEPFVISKTGKELTQEEYSILSMTNSLSIKKIKDFPKLIEVIKNLGLENENRLEQIHQMPPVTVRLIAEYFGIKDMTKLKPAIVTYWG